MVTSPQIDDELFCLRRDLGDAFATLEGHNAALGAPLNVLHERLRAARSGREPIGTVLVDVQLGLLELESDAAAAGETLTYARGRVQETIRALLNTMTVG